MKKEDIDAFIKIMKEIREDWTPERVEEEYGDCSTLREALDKRMSKIQTFYDYVEEVIKPDIERLGFLGAGSNSAVGRTVDPVVAPEFLKK